MNVANHNTQVLYRITRISWWPARKLGKLPGWYFIQAGNLPASHKQSL